MMGARPCGIYLITHRGGINHRERLQNPEGLVRPRGNVRSNRPQNSNTHLYAMNMPTSRDVTHSMEQFPDDHKDLELIKSTAFPHCPEHMLSDRT
jgi:hypothetical protein